jgi:hypothetical protein
VTQGQGKKKDDLDGAAGGVATVDGQVQNWAPSLAGESNGTTIIGGYLWVWAEWMCRVIAIGLPWVTDEPPTTSIALCTTHRDALAPSLLLSVVSMDNVGVPMPCVVCDPQFTPYTPDVP